MFYFLGGEGLGGKVLCGELFPGGTVELSRACFFFGRGDGGRG